MEKVRSWCGQPSDRGRLMNGTEHLHTAGLINSVIPTRRDSGIRAGNHSVAGSTLLWRLRLARRRHVRSLPPPPPPKPFYNPRRTAKPIFTSLRGQTTPMSGLLQTVPPVYAHSLPPRAGCRTFAPSGVTIIFVPPRKHSLRALVHL